MSGGLDIRLDGVSVRYANGVLGLDRLSLHVPAGQFCVVLGSSGAGKSTLLKTVNGLVAASEGTVGVGGRAIDRRSLPALRARMGTIHQHFGLAQRADVATNVIAGAVQRMPLWRALVGAYPEPLRDRACSLVAAVGLEERHLATRVDKLSGGQQQRVGIARAFMAEPGVILADEPVASLDPRTSREVLELVKLQARVQGATVLCSLHQVDLARAFADRIVAMQGGRILFDGPPAMFDDYDAVRIYERAPSPGVAALREVLA